MRKKKTVKLLSIVVCIAIYILLLCFSLYKYYYSYYLLQTGLVLRDAFIVSLPGLIIIYLIIYRKSKPAITKYGLGIWGRYMNAITLAVLFTIFSLFLLTGGIAELNSGIGSQQNVELTLVLANKERETGRGGGNPQFYYKFYDAHTFKVYVLRSRHDVAFNKQQHIELTKGSLGILYKN